MRGNNTKVIQSGDTVILEVNGDEVALYLYANVREVIDQDDFDVRQGRFQVVSQRTGDVICGLWGVDSVITNLYKELGIRHAFRINRRYEREQILVTTGENLL